MFDGLARWLPTVSCLAPCAAVVLDDEDSGNGVRREDTLSASVPGILRNMTVAAGSTSKRLESLRELYELTRDGEEGQRRVRLVCTSRWDVVTALSSCLTAAIEVGAAACTEDEKEDVAPAAEIRRVALLALNNLSVPHDNKAVMSLGAASSALLGALTRAMEADYAGSYLCASCLMNLSHLEDAVGPILYFCPENGGGTDDFRRLVPDNACREQQLPLARSNSLLRTLERVMLTFLPCLAAQKTTKKRRRVRSAEAEGLRWAVGFLRNVTAAEAHARLVARTEIPRVVVECVRSSPRPTVEWTKDSTEEMALQVMCNMAQWPECNAVLRGGGGIEAVEPIIGVGGIHDFRATMIKYSLEV